MKHLSADQCQLMATIAPIFMLVILSERRHLGAMSFQGKGDGRGWRLFLALAMFALFLITMICVVGSDDGFGNPLATIIWIGWIAIASALLGSLGGSIIRGEED